MPLSVKIAQEPRKGQRRTQPVADRPGALLNHQPGNTHIREWSSIPVSALALLPSASGKPPTTSICHNSIGAPRSQRFHFRDRRSRRRIDHPRPHQRPIHRRFRRNRPYPRRPKFEHQPPRTPNTAASDATQHRRPPRPASDADTTPADATGSANPPSPRPHSGPARHAPSDVTPQP